MPLNGKLFAPTALPALFALDQDIVPMAKRARVVRYLLANQPQSSKVMMFYYLFKQLYALDYPKLDTEVL